jgi:putative tricarboxylic transport membrane protein
MYPALLVVSFVSCYVESASLYKCGMLIVFAILGVVMAFGDLPVAPLILAFILEPTLESNMLKAFQYTGTGVTFFARPISCIFILLSIFSVFSPILRFLFNKFKKNKALSA